MATKYAKYAGTSRKRALDKVGTDYPAGWCLKFCLVELFGLYGIGDYDGDGSADAEDYAKAAKAAGQLIAVTDTADIPAGALVLWTGGSRDHGHAAYSLGDGEIVSTDLPTTGRIGRVPIAKVWPGLKLAGYVLVAPTGEHLVKPGKKPKVTSCRVTARSGLRGRIGPSTRTRTVTVAPYGSLVDVVDTVTGAGLSWGVTAEGIHYAQAYLAPVR